MCKRVLIIAIAFLAIALWAIAGQPSWTLTSAPAETEMTETEQIEVHTADQYVYISTPRPVTVKIFSILGQLISSQQIPAGTHRCRIDSRGIYILKAGPITRRITI